MKRKKTPIFGIQRNASKWESGNEKQLNVENELMGLCRFDDL